jgi:adenylate cyclase, class 2
MLNELEIKIRLQQEELASVTAKCSELFGPPLVVTQIDEYLDTEVEGLKKEDLTVRVRRLDNEVKIAVKTKRVFITDTIHDRLELEFTLANYDQIQGLIERGDLRVTAIYEKRRQKYIKDGIKVVIDELPYIGAFLEVEGPSTLEIQKILNSLGMTSGEGIKANYTELLEEKFRAIGLPVRPNLRATFEEEKRVS